MFALLILFATATATTTQTWTLTEHHCDLSFYNRFTLRNEENQFTSTISQPWLSWHGELCNADFCTSSWKWLRATPGTDIVARHDSRSIVWRTQEDMWDRILHKSIVSHTNGWVQNERVQTLSKCDEQGVCVPVALSIKNADSILYWTNAKTTLKIVSLLDSRVLFTMTKQSSSKVASFFCQDVDWLIEAHEPTTNDLPISLVSLLLATKANSDARSVQAARYQVLFLALQEFLFDSDSKDSHE